MPEAEGPNGAIPSLSEVSQVDQENGLPPSEWRSAFRRLNPFTPDGRLKTSTEDRLEKASKVGRWTGLPKTPKFRRGKR